MDKKVTEDFFTLAINPKNGYYRVSGNYLTYGILGAILMDLALAGAIELDGKNVIVKGRHISGIPAFDKVLDLLVSSSRVRSIRAWLRRLSVKAFSYRKEMQKTLVSNGVLKRERKRFLLIPYSLYFPTDPIRVSKLTLRLKEILLYNKEPLEHEVMFLGLVFACRMHRNLANSSHERQIIRKALKKYFTDNPYASGVSQSIMEMQAAITASVSAAIIASNTTSAST